VEREPPLARRNDMQTRAEAVAAAIAEALRFDRGEFLVPHTDENGFREISIGRRPKAEGNKIVLSANLGDEEFSFVLSVAEGK
jgi:hypothetical protein